MNTRLHGALATTRGTHQERANEDVWVIVRDLEEILPPAQMRLVHQLRLAAEMAGALRCAPPIPLPRA